MILVDFVLAAPFDGRRLQALTVVDPPFREALTIDIDQSFPGE